MASVAKTHDETHNADVVEHNNCNTNCNLSTISDINSNIKNQQLSNNNKKLHQSPTESVENFPLKCNKSEAGEKNENEDDQKGVSDCVENIINTSEPIANESAEKETKNKLATTVTDAENVNFSNTQANTMRLAVHDDEQLSRGTERDIDTYSTTANKYIAPEQALVTRVELVVAAPTAPTSLMDTILPLSNSESQYNTNVLFNTDTILSSSATVSNSSKNNGCEPDSSLNLNVRIPTNITTTAGDILITDRRPASIWAPHGQDDQGQHQGHHHQSQGTEKTKESSNVNLICNSGGYKSDIFRSHEQQHHHYHQGHSTELLLQIEKATATSADCFGAQINTIEHHNFCQQQQPSSAQNHQQHNIFPQMVQHPHPHQQHHQLQHPHHNIHQETMHNQQLPIHYADYSHQQYAHDQLFEIHHNHNQSHHHEQLQQEQQHQARLLHQRHIEYQGHLQQQQPIQQHSHHQQMQDASYHDLIMDEFHEDACLAYKLTLSPSNPKPESQDDGYETSAGDVLTPNSHTSSTHSVTPQHQMQHSNLGLVTQTKHDDPMSSKTSEQMQSIATNSNSPQVQVQSARLPHLNTVSQIENSSIANNVKVSLPNDPYSFISEDISILSPRARGHHSVDLPATSNASSYTPAPVSGSASDSTQPSDVYNINDNHQQQLEQQQPKSELVPESFEMKVNSKSTDVTNVICEINPSSQETVPKRRGRKKKINAAESVQIISQQCDERNSGLPAVDIQTTKPRERKKHDRFNGMSEADVIKRTIPDHLCDNLDIVIVGINPGLFAAYKGHHYAGPGNHFWKCLYLSGLTQEQMSADDDYTLLKQGIGFTNMVARATKGSADLTRKEIKEGSRILLEKLQRFQPKVAVFNGKLIFEVFSGKKEFHFGRQPDRVDGTNTYIWVMPSSSARCAQLPRAADKVPFYTALKKFRDFLNGLIPHLDESECVFTEQRIRQCCEQQEQLNSLSTPISSANTNHVEQQQPSNLMYGDGNMGGSNNMNASTICRNQSENQSLPHFTNQSQNSPTIVPRGGFIYGGNDESPKVSINDQNYLCVFGNQQQPQQQPQPQQPLLPEKKKRGRPKKIKEQEIIDSSSGSKVQQGQSMPQHDFNNILNLSMIAASNSSSGVSASATGETPTKKKRGRPKKLKPTIETMLSTANSKQQLQHHKVTHRTANSTPQQTTPSSMQAMSMSPQNSHQAPPSLYNTPPPSHLLYTASASPMASPALNCSYTTHSHGTPPVGAQVDPNFQQNTEDHQANQTNQVVDAVVRDQPHLGETPPPSSPQMCSADFGQPNSDELANVARGQESNSILMPRQSPVSLDKLHVPDHYQHWLASSQSQKNSQPLQLKSQARLSPVPVVHYSQAPHAPLNYQSDNQADQWQRYEEQARPYSMLASPHHQQHPHVNMSPQLSNLAGQLEIQTQISASDVSRKSLSGLESLVDQIPSISEHESNVISSATVSAAAAAVESRLLGLQHQKRCQPDNDNTHSENTTANQNNNSVTNNFSVSSLAESAALPTSIENHLGHNNNASKRPESGLNNNNSIEYSSQSTTGYPHHASHLTATISNQAPLSHPLPHPQMYMDHAHITSHMAHMPSVNVNALYGGSPYGPQHGSSAPEYAHGHYSVVQGATPTLHVPSPNYPYTHYSPHTPPQNNYTGFAHSHHHPHHHHHGHAAHHLSVFDRLKPSDISGYNGF